VFCVCSDERVYNTLYTACRTGNVSTVQQTLTELKAEHASSEKANADDAGEIPTDAVKVPTAVSQLLCHNEPTTLLHAASERGHVTVVRLLLQHGADPSIKYRICICVACACRIVRW